MKTNFLKTLFTFVFLICSVGTRAQLVNLGNQLKPGEIWQGYHAVANSGKNLWVVSQVLDQADSKYYIKISKHNGLFWSDVYRQQAIPNLMTRLSACFYNGDLYFNASFQQVTLNSVSYPKMQAILKWDGSSLSYVDSVGGGEIFDMDTFKGKLVIVGTFSRVGTTSFTGLAQYNGSAWSNVGNPADWVNFQPGQNYLGSQLVRQGNKLYLTGMYQVFDGSKPTFHGLGVYDGTSLDPLPLSEFTNAWYVYGKIFAHPDSARYYSSDSGFRSYYCGTGLPKIKVNSNPGDYRIYSLTREKYAYRGSSVFTVNGIDLSPQANSTVFIEKFTGKNHKKIYVPEHLRMNVNGAGLGIFGKEAVFLLFTNTKDGSWEFYRLDSNENLSATVSGKVFTDLNQNCFFDATEPVLKNTWVTLSPGNKTVLTDENGNYMIGGMPNGKYTVKVIKPAGKLYACPSSGQYTDTFTNDSNLTRDFALKFDPAYKDISVKVVAYRGFMARRGFDECYVVSVTNNSMYQRSGTVNLQLGSGFNSITSGSPSLVFTGNSGVLTFTNLKPDESLGVKFCMRTDLTLTLNSYLNLFAELDGTNQNWDDLPGNDRDTCGLRIVASCDPNDKSSKPSGNVPVGTRLIQYHINFQNVGNDTAFKVVVVDTIDLRLPLEKIVIGSASHPYKLRVVDNVLIFEFNDIKLVDSTTNEPKSKGYLRFSAHLQSNLPVGASVNNMADIYFDYNEAIRTNTTSVRITDYNGINDIGTQSKGLKVYPNPGSKTIYVNNENGQTEFCIYNVNGLLVYRGTLVQGVNEMDMSSLPSGVYALLTADGTGISKFIIQN